MNQASAPRSNSRRDPSWTLEPTPHAKHVKSTSMRLWLPRSPRSKGWCLRGASRDHVPAAKNGDHPSSPHLELNFCTKYHAHPHNIPPSPCTPPPTRAHRLQTWLRARDRARRACHPAAATGLDRAPSPLALLLGLARPTIVDVASRAPSRGPPPLLLAATAATGAIVAA